MCISVHLPLVYLGVSFSTWMEDLGLNEGLVLDALYFLPQSFLYGNCTQGKL